MTRMLNVARIHLVNWRIAVVLPVAILALVLALNVLIFAAVRAMNPTSDFSDGFATGGTAALYIFLFILALQAITQVFPFALGLSVTRRTFYLATALYLLASAVAFGLLLTLGLVLERATGGWGIDMTFFGSAMPAQENLFVHWLMFVALLLVSAAVGMAFGVVFKRWGQLGIYVSLVGLAVVITGAVLLITWQGRWIALFDAVAAQPPLVLGVAFPILLSVLIGGAGWLALRRATP